MRHTRKRNSPGFTLLEILIVMAVFSLISLTVYSVFNNGIKIWERLNKNMEEEDLIIFLEKFTADLRNCLAFKEINFYGDPERLEFAGLVTSPDLGNRTVGRISYSYDSGSKILLRGQDDFSKVFTQQNSAPRQVLKNVRKLTFWYYIYDSGKKEYLWSEKPVESLIPLAVRIEFEYGNGNQFNKSVSIPVSG